MVDMEAKGWMATIKGGLLCKKSACINSSW